jgi:AcrR family transcriptional regulator
MDGMAPGIEPQAAAGPRSTTDDSRAGPGRPRDSARHEAVIAAARELLREVGYSSLTIDSVAKRANASRKLIYRWWGQKPSLVAEVLFAETADLPTPDTGTLSGDVRALVDALVIQYAKREMVIGLPGLQADLIADRELLRSIKDRYDTNHQRRWKEVITRAVARGELRTNVNARAIAAAAVGAIQVIVQEGAIRARDDITTFVSALIVAGIRSAEPGSPASK